MKNIVYTFLFLSFLSVGCHAQETTSTLVQTPTSTGLARLKTSVISKRPHDPAAFTQGLLLFEGKLYESTGLKGRSSLRRVDPETGDVEQEIAVNAQYFAEGLALVDGKLIQLTWQDHKALVYDVKSFQQIDEFIYDGEGWGLCYDGQSSLYMSDGSATLTIRDAKTFVSSGRISVTLNGLPVANLNELEWVDGFIYANIWQKQAIVKINPTTGNVVATIRATDLLSVEQTKGADVLNGIAYDPVTKHFLITGKLWPSLFEVAFVEEKI